MFKNIISILLSVILFSFNCMAYDAQDYGVINKGIGNKGIATYDVTFVVDGESTVVSVVRGSQLKKPTNPIKKYYVFDGWYKDMACISKYDFSNCVDSDITLYAKFVKDDSVKLYIAESEKVSSYKDVSVDDWFSAAAEYVKQKGLMQGVNGTDFEPNKPMKRNMFVSLLYKIDGSPYTPIVEKFNDFNYKSWATDAVNWSGVNDIVYSQDGCFKPNDMVTREQMAYMIYKYAEYKGCNMQLEKKVVFKDETDVSDYAKQAVDWVISKGFMNMDEAFRPKDNATRAEVAYLFMNVIERLGMC